MEAPFPGVGAGTAVYLVVMAVCAWFAYTWLAPQVPTYTPEAAVSFFAFLTAVYFALSGWFAYVDLCHRPEWMWRRKYQEDVCVETDRYREAFQRTAVKFLVVLLPYLVLVFLLMRWRVASQPGVSGLLERGGAAAFFVLLVTVAVVADFAGWGVHKLLHRGALWTEVHSLHHRFVSPVAVGSLDAHPLEVIAWDALPLTLGPMVLGAPPAFLMVFVVVCVISTVLSHCGYDIGYEHGHHDLHHERMRCNYGSPLSDAVMGTSLLRERGRTYLRAGASHKDLDGSFNCRARVDPVTPRVNARLVDGKLPCTTPSGDAPY